MLEWNLALGRPRFLCLYRNPSQCTLQISGNTLPKIEKVKYLAPVFTNDLMLNIEIDAWIGKAKAVLPEIYRSVATKRELLNTEDLPIFTSIFVPILALWSWIWGNDWKSVISCTSGRDAICEDGICEECTAWRFATKCAASLNRERSRLQSFGHMTRMSNKPGKAAQKSTKDQEAWLHLQPSFVPSWHRASRITKYCWKLWGISSCCKDTAPTILWRKMDIKTNEQMISLKMLTFRKTQYDILIIL